VLVREPFNLTLQEIGRLTPYQARNIYFRGEERDRSQPKRQQPYRDVFWAVWKRRGLKDHQIELQWQQYQREQGNGGT
jgi:hypothetical protein